MSIITYDTSVKANDLVVDEYNGGQQTATDGTTTNGTALNATGDVTILRREYENDPDGLFASLANRQLGCSKNTSTGIVTIIFKDEDGVRHDWVEGDSGLWEVDNDEVVLKSPTSPLVLDQPAIPSALMFKIVQGYALIRNDEIYGVKDAIARNDYELTFFNKTDQSLTSNEQIYTDASGNLHVDSNIIQSGSSYETHVEQIYTTKDEIILRDGAVGGLSPTEYTGLRAKLYDGVNDGYLVWGADGYARVGDAGNLVVLTGRDTDGNLTDKSVLYWDAVNKIIKDTGILYTDLATVANLGDYVSKTVATVQTVASNLRIGNAEIGTLTFSPDVTTIGHQNLANSTKYQLGMKDNGTVHLSSRRGFPLTLSAYDLANSVNYGLTIDTSATYPNTMKGATEFKHNVDIDADLEVTNDLTVTNNVKASGKIYSLEDTFVLGNQYTTTQYNYGFWPTGVYEVCLSYEGYSDTDWGYQANRILLVQGVVHKYIKYSTAVDDGHVFTVISQSATQGVINIYSTQTGNRTITITAQKVA